MDVNNSISPGPIPKRKRGRPPKKVPIDTQTMTTAPNISISSGISMDPPNFESFQSTFDVGLSPITPKNLEAGHTNKYYLDQKKQEHAKKSLKVSITNIPSSPPTVSSSPESAVGSDGLGIYLNSANTPTTGQLHWPGANSHCYETINSSPHVNPSLIFYNNSSSPVSSLQSSSPRISPNTPHHTFSHIIHSSPLYNGYYTSPVVINDDDNATGGNTIGSLLPQPQQKESWKHQTTGFNEEKLDRTEVDPQLVVRPLLPFARTCSLPTERPSWQHLNGNGSILKETQENSISRKTILERRTSTNSISNKLKLKLRKGKEVSVIPPPRSNGAMSAPVPANSCLIERDEPSNNFKFKVSLSIDNNGQAVIQHQRSLLPYTGEGVKTLFDRSIDYLNDSARRMSLESLFPELSPRQEYIEESNIGSSYSSAISLPLELDSDIDTDYENSVNTDTECETHDSRENTFNANFNSSIRYSDEHTDARFALRRALEQRTALGSRSASVPDFGFYPISV